jgi:hypothetical protein
MRCTQIIRHVRVCVNPFFCVIWVYWCTPVRLRPPVLYLSISVWNIRYTQCTVVIFPGMYYDSNSTPTNKIKNNPCSFYLYYIPHVYVYIWWVLQNVGSMRSSTDYVCSTGVYVLEYLPQYQ